MTGSEGYLIRGMGMNTTNKETKETQNIVSIIGLLIVLLGMIYSVQADGSMIPDLMLVIGTVIILFAEKATLNESIHK